MDDDLEVVPDTMRLGTEEVRFRFCRLGDEEQIVGVLDAAFGGFYAAAKPVDGPDYIRWFTEPHDSHLASVDLATIGSRIVSVDGALYRSIKFGQRTLYGTAGGIGSGTLPEYQRQGIHRGKEWWADWAEEPPRTASVKTTRLETRSSRKGNVPATGRMGVYLYVQRPWRAARARKGGITLLNALPSAGLALWSRLRSRVGPKGARDATVRTLPAFDERFEAFLEQASAAWDVIPLRSVEFLNWRFCDPRAGAFTVLAAEEGGELVGYSVVHALSARGYIMDLLALPGRLDVVRTLVTHSVQRLGEAGTGAVECWMLHEQPYAAVLQQAGFFRLRGRSTEIANEVGWDGAGLGPEERALLVSPRTRMHLVRADFDGI